MFETDRVSDLKLGILKHLGLGEMQKMKLVHGTDVLTKAEVAVFSSPAASLGFVVQIACRVVWVSSPVGFCRCAEDVPLMCVISSGHVWE